MKIKIGICLITTNIGKCIGHGQLKSVFLHQKQRKKIAKCFALKHFQNVMEDTTYYILAKKQQHGSHSGNISQVISYIQFPLWAIHKLPATSHVISLGRASMFRLVLSTHLPPAHELWISSIQMKLFKVRITIQFVL